MSQALMKTPQEIDIEITSACNLRCRYCSHFSSPGDVSGDLPTSEWLSFFQELGNLGVMNVILTGGEAFLRQDILELIDGIIQNRMRFSILTNGTKITSQLAKKIAATHRCNYIQVSIDGATPEVHDSFRGRGVFKKAVAGLKILIEEGLPVTVRVTVHRQNYDKLEKIALYLLEDIGIQGFSTNYVSFMGLSTRHSSEVQLSVDERIHAMRSLLYLDQKYPGHITAAAGPLADARIYTKMEEARRNGESGWAGYLIGCGCPWRKIAVRADGIIIPCSHLAHMELGRINHDSLVEIWQHHPDLQRLRNRCEIPLSKFSYCRDCEYQPYCTGNCPGVGYNLTGDVYSPSPESCLKNFLDSGGSIHALNLNTPDMTGQ